MSKLKIGSVGAPFPKLKLLALSPHACVDRLTNRPKLFDLLRIDMPVVACVDLRPPVAFPPESPGADLEGQYAAPGDNF